MKFDPIKNTCPDEFAAALSIDEAKTANSLIFTKKRQKSHRPRIGCLRIQSVSFREFHGHWIRSRNRNDPRP